MKTKYFNLEFKELERQIKYNCSFILRTLKLDNHYYTIDFCHKNEGTFHIYIVGNSVDGYVFHPRDYGKPIEIYNPSSYIFYNNAEWHQEKLFGKDNSLLELKEKLGLLPNEDLVFKEDMIFLKDIIYEYTKHFDKVKKELEDKYREYKEILEVLENENW